MSTTLTVNDMPSNLKTSIEWVWTNRMVKEGSTTRKNLIFDQIYAGKGTINYVVRWQSSNNITLQQRKDIATMLNRQVNNWAKYLIGYDGWGYDTIPVTVVGWACANSSQILDKQSNEIVYTDYTIDDLSKTNSSIPAKLPYAPSSLSRFEHFTDSNYSYPGGLSKRFDMYLWGTTNFDGGAGGDWGQRMSDDYILINVNSTELTVIEHEMGHGFGLPDFYEDSDRPPTGFPTTTIMWAGNSQTITTWDVWMLRYTWSQLKKDTSRFNEAVPTPTPISDIVAYYKFDEKSGKKAVDSSVNGKNATLNGKASWAAGKIGNAVSFDGTSGYVSLPNAIVSNLNDFTISAWVKLNAVSDWARVFDFGTGTNSYMFLAPSAGGAGLRFGITTNGNGNEEQMNASSALAAGTWKHVAVTLSGNTGILYVDGVEVARNNSMTLRPSSLGSTNQNYIGKSQWSDPYLNGLVDEFKIYNRALSVSEISAVAAVIKQSSVLR